MIDIRVTETETKEQLVANVEKRLGKFWHKTPNVIRNALNRTAQNIQSNIKKEVRQRYVIKASHIQEAIGKPKKATFQDLTITVKTRGGPIPLDRFKIKPGTASEQQRRRKLFNVTIKKGETKEMERAFVTDFVKRKKDGSSAVMAFRRTGKTRLPVERLFGPTIPSMINNEEVRENIMEEATNTFQKRLDHEIDRILKKS